LGVFALVLSAGISLLVLLAVALLLPVRFRFRARFTSGPVAYEAWLRLPLLPWFIRLPMRPASRREAGGTAPQVEEAEGSFERMRSFLDSARSALVVLREVYPRLADTFASLGPAIRVEQFRLSGRAGTGDAFDTALLVGALISFAGILLSLVERKGVRFAERPRVRLAPVFDASFVSVDLLSTVSVVSWRGIRAAFLLGREIRKMRASSRAFVSNSPGWNTKA
jgi:hypothetical protein